MNSIVDRTKCSNSVWSFRPVFGAEQCIVTRLGIVGFTTLMGTSNQEHPWLPHCPGDMEERMRKVMVTGLVQRVSILLLSY